MKKQLELIQHLTNLLHGLRPVATTNELKQAVTALELKLAIALNAIEITTE